MIGFFQCYPVLKGIHILMIQIYRIRILMSLINCDKSYDFHVINLLLNIEEVLFLHIIVELAVKSI